MQKLFRRAYIAISIYVVFLSLLPLVNDFMSSGKWVGYGWGAYSFENGVVSIKFSEIMYGVDKPKILVSACALGRYVDTIEFSDHESYVDNLNIFYDCNITSIRVSKPNSITYSYICKNVNALDVLVLNKVVEIPLENVVNVTYIASREAVFEISLWRWYYEAVNNVTFKSMGKKAVDYLGKLSNIVFTFCDRVLGCYNGTIFLSSFANVYVYRDEKGLNKFVVKAMSRSINFLVYVNSSCEKKSIATLLQSIASAKGLHVVMPLIAAAILLFGWWRWVRG